MEEEEEEKEDGKGMTMVKGRGTEVDVGGEPSKEGVKRKGWGERKRGTDPGGVVAVSAEIGDGRSA